MEHLTRQVVEELQAKRLTPEAMVEVVRHLEACAECHDVYRAVFHERRGGMPLTLDLTGWGWHEDDHLEYEEIADLVGGRLDDEYREILSLHLGQCHNCREAVADLEEFSRSRDFSAGNDVARQAVILDPVPMAGAIEREEGSQRRGFQLSSILSEILAGNRLRLSARPLLATVAVLVAAGMVGLLVSRRDSDERIASGVTTSSAPSAGGIGISRESVERREATVATIIDGSRKIIAAEDGRLLGLESIPGQTREAVSRLLLGSLPERPEILLSLRSSAGRNRGDDASGSGPDPQSPLSAVIATNRPVLRWRSVVGATGYRVDIANPNERSSISSPILSADTTSWQPTSPLRRGVLFTWSVTAMVDGGEVTSPSINRPEARFFVLDAAAATELRQLETEPVSRLALGLFFARQGMTREAQRELAIVAGENPESVPLRQLMEQLSRW